MAVEKRKLRAMKVLDTRFPNQLRVISYLEGSIAPTYDGFEYSYEFEREDGDTVRGWGIVENEKYAGMSGPEIELTCAIENPVSDPDRRALAILEEMKEEPE